MLLYHKKHKEKHIIQRMDHKKQDILALLIFTSFIGLVLAYLSLLPSADDSRADFSENHMKLQKKQEEWKIRGELENEIERDLEEEIKDGIYHLAFRLHRLYQHKRERNNGEVISEKDKTLSEVNISIKMEGGTKIEIKETEKEDHSRAKNVTVKGMLGSKSNGKKKFDWAKSLREGTEPAIVSRSYEAKVPSSNGRGSMVRKGNIGVNNKNLEQGWKW